MNQTVEAGPKWRPPVAVVELVERAPRVRDTGCLVSRTRVKPMTYQIDTCRFLVSCTALLGHNKNLFVQCQDNLTEGD